MNIDQLLLYFSNPALYFPNIDWVIAFWFAGLTFLMLGLLVLLFLMLKLVVSLKQLRSVYVLLEVKPLRESEQSAHTTQQLFSLLHGIGQPRSRIDKWLQVTQPMSFEIVSTKKTGIRYLIRLNNNQVDQVKSNLVSYLPGIKVSEVDDYLPHNLYSNMMISELAASNHFAYPLKAYEDLSKSDPIAYLTGNMTKLGQKELVAYQLVVSPLNRRKQSEIKRISKLIYTRKDLIVTVKDKSRVQVWLKLGLLTLLQLLLLPIGLLVFIVTNGCEGPLLSLSGNREKNKTSNPYQQELETLIKKKLDQPLFNASIRLLAYSSSQTQSEKRLSGLKTAVNSMSRTSYQSLVSILKLKLKMIFRLKWLMFKYRAIWPLGKTLLSVTEVGDLYHFPFTKITKTEDLIKEHSKELPAPIALKKGIGLDVLFAQNTYGGTQTPIGLTMEERHRHMYVLGATGTGKSTMLLTMIDSDLGNNKGVAVIDPHGDLIEEILNIIPQIRIADVVYFNPDDIGYPMGINLLELSEGLSEEDALREKEFITESIISLFHKIYAERYSGPRMEYILRNTIHTAFTIPEATLFTVYKLLINTRFRKSVVRKLQDENLQEFWKYEFSKAGDYQKVSVISPITNKIGRFLFSPSVKRILEQPKSTIDFDEILNQGKILLCNLSKGKVGEDNSKLFGVMMLAKIQLAALKRSRMKMEDRRDFYLYVDEFQNFATPAFAQILSEARKYKLSAILAHQTTSQIEDKSLVDVTLANTGTVICFRTANPKDEAQILPQFRPYVEPGEIASLPSYRFYMRLGALNPEEPFSGVTTPIEVKDNPKLVKAVTESSRNLYARKYQANQEIQVRREHKSTRNISTLRPQSFSTLP